MPREDIRVVDWRQQSPLPQQGSAPSHTLSGKSSGTLELLTGVNKVPFPNKEAPLRIRSAASRRGH